MDIEAGMGLDISIIPDSGRGRAAIGKGKRLCPQGRAR